MFPHPTSLRERDVRDFDPDLVDDLRACLVMRTAGRLGRANWMLVQVAWRHPAGEVGRLLRCIYFDTQNKT